MTSGMSEFLESLIRSGLGQIWGSCAEEICAFAKANKLIVACGKLGILTSETGKELLSSQLSHRKKVVDTLPALDQTLCAAGIDCAVIKGMSFEKAIYGENILRDAGDIDILIRPDDIPKAHTALLGMGYKQRIGPSSGSLYGADRAMFVAKVARQQCVAEKAPLRLFPYKDSYCPYIRLGYPTIELHDGFRGLPDWYTNAVVSRAATSDGILVTDDTDNLILLLMNSYENAESFYSNCYDGKLTLRDFVDLACLFHCGRCADWEEADYLVSKLGITDKAGRVMKDLKDLFPNVAIPNLPSAQCLESLWGIGIRDRMVSQDACRKAVLNAVRKDIKKLASRSVVGFSQRHPKGVETKTGKPAVPSFLLLSDGEGIKFLTTSLDEKHDGSVLLVFTLFGTADDDPSLCWRIMAVLEGNAPSAFLQSTDRLPDSVVVWRKMGMQLATRYTARSNLEISIPSEKTISMLQDRKTAITACLYDKHHVGVYWSRCRGIDMLTGDVSVNRMSLYLNREIESACLEFSQGKYIFSSEDVSLLAGLLDICETAHLGVPIDCDSRETRACFIFNSVERSYAVSIDGKVVLSCAEASQAIGLVMQDLTDWVLGSAIRKAPALHAASNLTRKGSILLMGEPGSGKTTLSLALSKKCPLRGDECAFIDLDRAATWTEPLPFNVKEGNSYGLSMLGEAPCLACESDAHGRSFYFNRRAVNSDETPFECRPIEAILVPKYDPKSDGVLFSKPSYEILPQIILRSFIGLRNPAKNLKDFIIMIDRSGIELSSVTYGDADKAAVAIEQRYGCERDAS